MESSVPDEDTLSLAILLKEWRCARHLSIGALASRAYVNKSTISRWEAATQLPCIPEIESVLNALQVPPSSQLRAISLINSRRSLPRLCLDTLKRPPPPFTGELLQAIRWRAGWTQEESAILLEVPRSSLARWEGGISWPSRARLARICEQLGAHQDEGRALERGMFLVGAALDETEAEDFATVFQAIRDSGWADALFAFRLLSLESCLWLRMDDSGFRPLLAQTYELHAEWLESIGQPARSATYAHRSIQLKEMDSFG